MKLLPVLFVILAAIGYFGYQGYSDFVEQKVQSNKKTCVNGFDKGSYLSANAPKFCACNADFIKNNPFSDATDKNTKERIGQHVRSCMDTHNKPVILKECEAMSKKMIEADAAYYVECQCFYDKLVEPMLRKWVDGEISSNQMKGGAEKVALDSLNACMKMR